MAERPWISLEVKRINIGQKYRLIRIRGRLQISSRKKNYFLTPLPPPYHRFSKQQKNLYLNCHKFFKPSLLKRDVICERPPKNFFRDLQSGSKISF